MAKLTKAQRVAAQAIAKGDVRYRNCGHAAWRIFGASPGVVGRMVSIGLATWPGGRFSEAPAELTDAGRAALQAGAQDDR